MFKIETHLHTVYVSKCGHLDAETIVNGYRNAGYTGIVVTDHFNRDTFDCLGIDLAAPHISPLEAFQAGYRRIRDCAARFGIRVYRGAEVRFDENLNDYLLYGWEDDLLRDPEAVFQGGLAAFSRRCQASGAFLAQAHPFRDGCTPATPAHLCGMEVFNGHPRHDSRNSLAAAFAEAHGLIPLAGSDCHRPPDIGISGIWVETLPEDDKALASLLFSRKFTPIIPE